MNRVQRLKAKLFEMDDRVLFLERMQIIQACTERYAAETAGLRFGHTLQDLLSQISIVLDDDDLIVGRVAEVLPTGEQERWFEANRTDSYRPQWFFTDGHLTQQLMTELKEGRELSTSLLFNVFENVAFDRFSGLKIYRDHIRKLGADNVHLCGSGPALFTLVKDKEQAEDLYAGCKNQGM